MLRPISYSLALLGSLAWFVPSISHAQDGGLLQLVNYQCAQGCGPGSGDGSSGSGDMGDSGMTGAANNAMTSSQADSFGSASGPSSGVPGMLGDSYIIGTAVDYTLGTSTYRTVVPYGGRYKCADNTGPVPTNRVSFAYKHFHNALQSTIDDGTAATFGNGQVDSYTLGVEQLIFQNRASLELRVPMYAGSVLNANSAGAEQSITTTPAFGNLSFILKTLFYRDSTLAIGGGIGLDIPTAEDTDIIVLGAQPVTYSSKQYYIAPFLAFLSTPNDMWWTQGVVQFSFVSGSNELFAPGTATGSGVTTDTTLRFHEQDMVFTTFNVGRWLYKDPSRSFMPGVALMGELNWTATLDHTNVVNFDDPGGAATISLANFANEQHIFNMTLGTHLQLTDRSNLRVSGVVPLRSNNPGDAIDRNRYFDGELSVQFNRLY